MGSAALQPVTVGAHRYDALDSLRGVCACMVVLFHFRCTGVLTNLPFIQGGWMFVDFFFVLSGFVIAASYGARLAGGFPFGRYMTLRFGRIYPLHGAVLAAFVAIELLGTVIHGLSPRPPFTGSRSLPDLVIAILLLQTFNLPGGMAWNNPAWSIAAEFWTYIVAGLVFAFTGAARGWIVGAIIVATCAWLASTPNHLAHDADFGVIRCLYGFFIGSVAHGMITQARRFSTRAGRGVATLIEVAIWAVALWLVAVVGNTMATMLAPPLFGLVVIVFGVERGWISKVLLSPPMRRVGLLSYSIYMVHVFVQGRMLDVLKIVGERFGLHWVETLPNGFKNLVAPPLVSDILTVIMLFAVIAVASGTYYAIERPAREWSRRLAARIWDEKNPKEISINS